VAGAVGLILPDVRFDLVSEDYSMYTLGKLTR